MHFSTLTITILSLPALLIAAPAPGPGLDAAPLAKRACQPWTTYCNGKTLTLCDGASNEVALRECPGGCMVVQLGSGATTAWCGAESSITFG